MLTRDEFVSILENEFESFKEGIMKSTADEIFKSDESICKTESIKDYLVDCMDIRYPNDLVDEDIVEKLYEHTAAIYENGKYNLLNELSKYELVYDEPMWASMDNLTDLVIDYVSKLLNDN